MASSFLDLPPEIRVQIYEHHFALMYQQLKVTTGVSARRKEEPRYRLEVALLQTSKVIYTEALPVLYSNVTFNILICSSQSSYRNPERCFGTPDSFIPFHLAKKVHLEFSLYTLGDPGAQDISTVTGLLEALDWCSGIKELTIDLSARIMDPLRAGLIVQALLKIKCSGTVRLLVAHNSTWTRRSGFDNLVASSTM